ncbi:MAG: 3-deoxy-manno-octulosonate cytidylyltransferase [Gammaproteobacteria bacterium]|nr:3-deoxy-manno-octulosonate cytidylyltransferase [Gammaproteobacteria bacterium]
MNAACVTVIPARYSSSRLPGKPLLEIAGQSMIQRVYAQALAAGSGPVIIATDDERIEQAARAFGADVELTGEHPSGSDRLAAVVARRGLADDTIVINLQGDEPLMPPAVLRQVARALTASPEAEMATVAEPLTSAAEWRDPNVVKLVTNEAGEALYFSRGPIPWPRGGEDHPPLAEPAFRRHVGLYAYRARFLREFVSWPPAVLEQLESLEQLRALARGIKIQVVDAVEATGFGIDTPADLVRVRALLGEI